MDVRECLREEVLGLGVYEDATGGSIANSRMTLS